MLDGERSPKRPRVRAPSGPSPRALLAWFDANRRPLPWRGDRNPYRTWVSEVVLQQTRVAQAVRVYRRFLHKFPDVRTLAGASQEEVLKAWEGAGYYARARRLQAASRVIVRRGRVHWPTTSDAWRRLPGVGAYLSAAIASLAFGEPVPALDANARRVASRWWLVDGTPGSNPSDERLRRLLGSMMPPSRAGDFNEAVMELGETICLPRAPRCPQCPVARGCRARQELIDPGVIPGRPRAKHRRPHVIAAIAAVERNGRWLVRRRPSEGLLGGLWELPGGKLEPGESPEGALRREVAEEAGLGLDGVEPVGIVRHAYSHFTVELHLFRARASGVVHVRKGGAPLRWVTPEEFEALPRPLATTKAVRLLGTLPRVRGSGISGPSLGREGPSTIAGGLGEAPSPRQ